MELSRRRVMRAAGIYMVTLWLLAQGVADLFPAFGLPPWTVRAFVLSGFLGFPIVILLAWRYELTPQGLIPDSAVMDPDTTLINFPASGIAKLCWTDAAGELVRESFYSEFVVGRDAGNAIQISDQRVSRKHARFYPDKEGWWVVDLDSSNGTYLEGERIGHSRLGPRNVVRLHPEGPKLTVEIVGTVSKHS